MFSIFSRLLELFSFRKQPQEIAQPTAPPIKTQPEIKTPETAEEKVRPVDATPEKETPDKIKVPKTNRHGLPLIHPKEDLNALFAKAPQDDSNQKKANRIRPRDRHGICRLSPSDDLFNLFNGQDPSDASKSALPDKTKSEAHRRFRQKEKAENDEFARLLERQLAGKSLRDLLREKTDGVKPETTPVSLRTRRYPGPQAELDLHGYTARQAEEKTALFIDASRHQGLLTLRIIVGKGSHSPDGPVLPDAVARKLSELKSSGQVLDFRWERRVKSKSGAVIVYLDAGV